MRIFVTTKLSEQVLAGSCLGAATTQDPDFFWSMHAPGINKPARIYVKDCHWILFPVQAATEARKQVLKLDNLYTNKAVDALLNYETVKLFNNEALEVSQYDEYLVGYQVRFDSL